MPPLVQRSVWASMPRLGHSGSRLARGVFKKPGHKGPNQGWRWADDSSSGRPRDFHFSRSKGSPKNREVASLVDVCPL
jgi:hypothetical protein